MSFRDVEYWSWCASNRGAVTRSWLLAHGFPSSTVQEMVERSELVAIGPGRYRSSTWPDDDRRQLLSALCQHNDGIVVSHTTAGQEWGLRLMQDPRVHVLCPHGRSPDLEGVVVHRCRRIDPVDVVQFDDGVRMTSPPRALFDASSIIGVDSTASVIEQMINERRCTLGTLLDTTRRLAHSRRPGSKEMRAALASRPPWRAALQSDKEAQVLRAIKRFGLPEPVAQCPIMLEDGRVIHADFGWPEFLVAIEVDDPFWHDFFEEARRDKRRDRKAAAVGWQIGRIPTPDLADDLNDALNDVAAVLRRRGWQG